MPVYFYLMDIATRKKEMYALIEQWHRSGLSRTAWCKEKNIARNTFRNWWRKYQVDHDVQQAEQQLACASDQASFIAIGTRVLDQSDSPLMITYPNGARLSCPMGIDTDQLKILLGLLDN